ncbi:MAG: serine/threonine protein kinase [Alphaproteobacteria bacterium]|nr:serine/threonine protein kinase [Alphaproteobacteria bacterium]
MSRPSRDRYVGTTLGGRFHVTRPLADGGMARVYVARDGETDTRVAVKILVPRPGPRHDAMLERMRREAVALERLDHPNIVKTLTHGPTDDGGFFIAMELIEGPSITEFIKANRTEPEGGIQLLLQVCSALRHAHRKGIVHRDLKSSNLLVAKDEQGRARVKLIDFGIVKLADEDSLSGSRQIVGSVHTIAPEQVKGEPLDHRADIYAVGILAYRLMAGEYPYHSRVPTETITQHVHAEIPVLSDPGLPYGLSDIVARCMAKDPDDRFADVQELMDELSATLDVPTAAFTRPVFSRTRSIPPTEARPEAPAERPRSRVALLAGGVLIAAVALLWVLAR